MTYYKAVSDNYGNSHARSAAEIGGPWQAETVYRQCEPMSCGGYDQTATESCSEVGAALARLEKEQSILAENVYMLRARLAGALMPTRPVNEGWGGAEEPESESSELVYLLRQRINDTIRLKNEVATVISLLTL